MGELAKRTVGPRVNGGTNTTSLPYGSNIQRTTEGMSNRKTKPQTGYSMVKELVSPELIFEDESTSQAYRSILEAREETASSKNNDSEKLMESGEQKMDEATRMILERLERDGRERESRYHTDAAERESRYREDQQHLLSAINSMKTELRSDIAEFKGEVKTDLSNFKQEIKADIAKMDTKLDSTYKHITAITIAAIVGVGAIVIAVMAALFFG